MEIHFLMRRSLHCSDEQGARSGLGRSIIGNLGCASENSFQRFAHQRVGGETLRMGNSFEFCFFLRLKRQRDRHEPLLSLLCLLPCDISRTMRPMFPQNASAEKSRTRSAPCEPFFEKQYLAIRDFALDLLRQPFTLAA